MNNPNVNNHSRSIPEQIPEENTLSYRARILGSAAAGATRVADFDLGTTGPHQPEADPVAGRRDSVDWSENHPAPGMAGLLNVKRVGKPIKGSPEYGGSMKIVNDVARATRKVQTAVTADTRLDILAKTSKSAVRKLDGRQLGLALIEGDQRDPLYLFATLARRVRDAIIRHGSLYYSAAEALDNLSHISVDEITFEDLTDPRVEAFDNFVKMVRFVTCAPTEPVTGEAEAK